MKEIAKAVLPGPVLGATIGEKDGDGNTFDTHRQWTRRNGTNMRQTAAIQPAPPPLFHKSKSFKWSTAKSCCEAGPRALVGELRERLAERQCCETSGSRAALRVHCGQCGLVARGLRGARVAGDIVCNNIGMLLERQQRLQRVQGEVVAREKEVIALR